MNQSPESLDDMMIETVRQFNSAMRAAVSGPNCIDSQLCHADCCFIHLDIPKALAQFLIGHKWATQDHFQRGSIFSFEVKVDLSKLRCVFYDTTLNGCALHQTGVKPPQCWVYPTGLDIDHSQTYCKRAQGWKIIDAKQIDLARNLMDAFVILAKDEALKENSQPYIRDRLLHTDFSQFCHYPPTKIAGIRDSWDSFEPLIEEGYNVGLQSICKTCACERNYLECPEVCDALKRKLQEFLDQILPDYIIRTQFKETYTWLELLSDSRQFKEEKDRSDEDWEDPFETFGRKSATPPPPL